MRLILSTLFFSLFLSLSLNGDLSRVKDQISVLKAEHSIIDGETEGYYFWFSRGYLYGLRSSLLVINMHERSWAPYTPPITDIKRDLSVLSSISSQISYEGFQSPEGYWYEQGVRNAFSMVTLLLDDETGDD